MITRARRLILHLTPVALLLLAAAPSSAETVAMKFVSAGNNVMAGVYVNPYEGTVDGVSAKLICDAFSEHSFVGETWTANVTDFSDLSNTLNTKKLGLTPIQQTLYYNQAAWLATQLLGPVNPTTAGQISFALWGVFDPTAIPHLTSASPTNAAGAQQWLDLARAQTFTPGQFSNVLVYSPNMNYPVRCGSGPCPASPPQEFLVVKTPEPVGVAFIFADALLFGVVVVGIVVRRRKRAAFRKGSA